MTQPDLTLRFTEQELDMLGKTADGLSAYMGKSVLAEVGIDDDAEWVIFAIPIGTDETPDDAAMHVQMGGSGARFVGNKGGLDLDHESYDCQYLWAIQITSDPEARFVRLDDQGEEFDFSNTLGELLPFELSEEALPDPDLELQEDLNEEDDDGDIPDLDQDSDERPRGPLH